MAIATRPKPKVHHKKRQAKHHRQSRHYLKAYHPYLPVLGVLALGYLANRFWPASFKGSLITDTSATRIEAATSGSSTALLAVILLATAAFGVYLFLHWYRIQRVLSRGERFVVKHPWLDVVLAAVFTLGVVLTRTGRY